MRLLPHHSPLTTHHSPLTLLSPDVEGHALRERQCLAVVDGVGGAAHIGLPGIGACLAAAAGFLLAAECAADLGARRADIDVGDAAIRADDRDECLGFAQVGGEDRRRQARRRRRCDLRAPRRSPNSASRRGSARKSRAKQGRPAWAFRRAQAGRSSRPRMHPRCSVRRHEPCRPQRAIRRAPAPCRRRPPCRSAGRPAFPRRADRRS